MVSDRLTRLEELLHSICLAPSSTTPLSNPTWFFSSLSPEYSGFLLEKEPRSIPCRRLSFDDMSPDKTVEGVHATVPPLSIAPGLEVLTAVTLDEESLFQPFHSWYKRHEHVDLRVEHLPVPTQLTIRFIRNWFDKLWNLEGWLTDQHVDVLTAYLLLQFRVQPGSQVGVVCCGALVHFGQVNILLIGDVGWKQSRRIFGIGHVHPNHWVCYLISIDEQSITIFDSSSMCDDREQVLEDFRHMSTHMLNISQWIRLWYYGAAVFGLPVKGAPDVFSNSQPLPLPPEVLLRSFV
ncbi:hypothetical protein C2S53_000131 [Perilla frutescens var. hirtella]|uniref:Uncharacterized protein n=1 Tax=Perilla frutescens var. hirtella TaxID=608512 RepID=A0AAD4IXI8_PERFH|nr:hypothetical protein C2S53_000131 [Perilla frutescens var. hirtella]